MNRRELFAALAAGAIMTAEGLWMPGAKSIFLPAKRFFIPTPYYVIVVDTGEFFLQNYPVVVKDAGRAWIVDESVFHDAPALRYPMGEFYSIAGVYVKAADELPYAIWNQGTKRESVFKELPALYSAAACGLMSPLYKHELKKAII